MRSGSWQALVLAAGRGPDDPMASAYSVTHKCLVPVGGIPMLSRVVASLMACADIGPIAISIDDQAVAAEALGDLLMRCEIVPAQASAARSAIAALDRKPMFPSLITTGDHPLLTPEMVQFFLDRSASSGADLCVGLASRAVIERAHPDTKRTYLRFADNEVSGCNLFAFTHPRALEALRFWHYLEPVRKKPWRLAKAFGLAPLLQFITRTLTLDRAFAIASRRWQITTLPILMPFAEAAIDVDKPADKELAEKILLTRSKRGDGPG